MADLERECGCEGVVWFTWTIAHLDVEGRVHGDPDLMKAQVCPRLAGVTPELIRSTAGKALELGLIDIYEVDGDIYIQYPSFEENQAGLRKNREQKSEIPPPSGVVPELFRSNSGVGPEQLPVKRREEKRSKEKRREQTETGSNQSCQTASPSDLSVSVKSVLDHYLTHHPKRKTQAKSTTSRRKVQARLKEGYTAEQLKQAIDGNQNSEFHTNGGHDSIELIFRDAAHVDRFIKLAEQSGKPLDEHGNPRPLRENEKRL